MNFLIYVSSCSFNNHFHKQKKSSKYIFSEQQISLKEFLFIGGPCFHYRNIWLMQLILFQYREDVKHVISFKSTYYVWQMDHISVYNPWVFLRQNLNWHCHWFFLNNKASCFVWHNNCEWWWVKAFCQVQQPKFWITSVTSQSNWEQCSVYHASVSENFLYLTSLWKHPWMFS